MSDPCEARNRFLASLGMTRLGEESTYRSQDRPLQMREARCRLVGGGEAGYAELGGERRGSAGDRDGAAAAGHRPKQGLNCIGGVQWLCDLNMRTSLYVTSRG